MATHSSSIDDLLMGEKTLTQPSTPEHQPEIDEPDEFPDLIDEPEEQNERKLFDDEPEQEEPEEEEPQAVEAEDEYGNPAPESKTYTEDEVNERINKAIRERLARLERNNQQPVQPQQAPAQQAPNGFEYNPDSAQDWQQQLEQFVEQTFSKITTKQQQAVHQQREQQAQMEFETKFSEGMGKFKDFHDVVASQPITDAMTIATRSMKDPAAFLYAASKRNPQELQRIANLPDQYAQMVEIGKLEERMRKAKEATKAPRPVSRTPSDSSVSVKETKEPSIEDLIRQSEQRKEAKLRARRR